MFQTAAADMPRIRCATCDKPVDRVEVCHDSCNKLMHITAWCHGAKDSMEIDARDASPGVLQQMRNQEGVAFLPTPRLTKNF